MNERIDTIVIAGGGLAGWMTAAALARAFRAAPRDISVVDDGVQAFEGTSIGGGVSTLESIRAFHAILGLDENEIMRRTQGTFKLGVNFQGWCGEGSGYFHPFGDLGVSFGPVAFHQIALMLAGNGATVDLADFSPATLAARAGRFERPRLDNAGELPGYSYGLHLDRFLYRNGLRAYAQQGGVRETAAAIADVKKNSDDGSIEALQLNNGETVTGDLFIDCTGREARLVRGALGAEYEDWSQWLPCDRMIEVATGISRAPSPFTAVAADEKGWRRRIPLQHCASDGFFYSSAYSSDDEALEALQKRLEGPQITEPKISRIHSGRLKTPWLKNCVAIGDAAGAMEPLEATELHMVQSGVIKLIGMFPFKGCACGEADEYARRITGELDRIRDLAVLHYATNGRHGEAFWDERRSAAPPDSLQYKIDLFKSRGVVGLLDDETFLQQSWAMSFYGNGVVPKTYDPLADGFSVERCARQLDHIKKGIAATVAAMPEHGQYILRNCVMRAPGRQQPGPPAQPA